MVKMVVMDKGLMKSSKMMGSGMATMGLGGVGTGMGMVFGSLMNSTGSNPSMSVQLFSYTMLGFALVEAMGLFALMMSFLLLFGV